VPSEFASPPRSLDRSSASASKRTDDTTPTADRFVAGRVARALPLGGAANASRRGSMPRMRAFDPKTLQIRPFSALDDEWALLVAGVDRPNPMTVSWGAFGTVWNLPVVTVYVRPTRFTYGLLNATPEFTLNFLPEHRRDALDVCGSTSGRDGDKWALARIHPETPARIHVPRVAEAKLSFECRLLATLDLDPTRFVDASLLEHYPDRDFHRVFLGQVVAAFAAP
jgi:flavin reductase (DIM6/NTAB) family NADH-FMN oxidoreductase RutF